MILNDLKSLSIIFSDTKRRAVSLRQLSFLFTRRQKNAFVLLFPHLPSSCVVVGKQFWGLALVVIARTKARSYINSSGRMNMVYAVITLIQY